MVIAEHMRAINMAMDRLRIATEYIGSCFDDEDTARYLVMPPPMETLAVRIETALEEAKKTEPYTTTAREKDWTGWHKIK